MFLLCSRCVQLWEPDKETLFTRSGESWQTLLSQIQGLLLQSFSRHLESFEEKVRLMREKYADQDWSFMKYFTVHVIAICMLLLNIWFLESGILFIH